MAWIEADSATPAAITSCRKPENQPFFLSTFLTFVPEPVLASDHFSSRNIAPKKDCFPLYRVLGAQPAG
jgi:hypothetical protein